MTTPTLSPRELALQADTDVLGCIQRENAVRDAQAEAEGWEFWTLVDESVAEDYDNVYDYLREGEWNSYSDTYKEIYHSRPRWDFSQWTLEDFERENEALYRAAEEIDQLRKEEEKAEARYWKSQQKTNAAWADYVAVSKKREARENTATTVKRHAPGKMTMSMTFYK